MVDEVAAQLAQTDAIESELHFATLLFADMVQSTRMLASLGPDEAREHIDEGLRRMRSAIHSLGGVIARVQGDGILALFGAPHAAEDHALRACLAGQEIVAAFRDWEMRSGEGPQHMPVRVGVHCGRFMTRRLQNDFSADLDVVGWPAHVASRTERLCRPNAVAVTDAVVAAAGARLSVQPLDTLHFGNEAPPVEVFELAHIELPDTLSTYFRTRPASPLVGRDRELDLLLAQLEQSRRAARTVALVGPGGIGKSRLCLELIRRAPAYGFAVVEVRPRPWSETAAFTGVRRLSLAIRPPERRPVETSCLDRLVAGGRTADLPPEVAPRLRRDALGELTLTFEAATSERPLLVVIDDLQHLDRDSIALIAELLPRLAGRGLMIVATARSEARSEAERVASTVMTLDRLSSADLETLATHLRPEIADEPRLLRHTLECSDGLPFILEELLGTPTSGAGEGPQAIPPSVDVAIRSRLDGLPATARHAALVASLLGREFDRQLLFDILDLDGSAFAADLHALERRGILSSAPGTIGRFAHEVISDVCSRSLAAPQQRRIHAAIVDAIKRRYNDLTPHYERLADHSARAGNLDKALDYLWQATLVAARQSAVRSVMALRAEALAICAKLGEAADIRVVDFALLTFDALQQQGQFEIAEAGLVQAHRIARSHGDARREAQVAVHLATLHWFNGAHSEALGLAQQAYQLARSTGRLPLTVSAQFTLANVLYGLGKLSEAIALLAEQVDTLKGDLSHSRLGSIVLPGVLSRAFLGWFLTDRGSFSEAAEVLGAAHGIAEAAAQPYSRIVAKAGLGLHALRRGAAIEATEVLRAARDICRGEALFAMDPAVTGWLAQAFVRCGDAKAAIAAATDSIDNRLYRHAARGTWAYLFCGLAEAMAFDGQLAEAVAASDRSIDVARESNEPIALAYSHLSRAQILETGRVAAAADAYFSAMVLASRHGLRFVDAEARAGLARLAAAKTPSEARVLADQAAALFAGMGLAMPEGPLR